MREGPLGSMSSSYHFLFDTSAKPARSVEVNRRLLRELRAKYQRQCGDLRELIRKRGKQIRTPRKAICQMQGTIKEAQEAVSEEVSSCSSLIGTSSDETSSDTDSGTDNHAPTPVLQQKKVKTEQPVRIVYKGKGGGPGG